MENNMKKALHYFQTMGIPTKDGYIDAFNLTEEQITMLKKWRDNTIINGIMMTEEEDFYRFVLLAISLQQQKDKNGKVSYLFGSGIGVEIALRGTIKEKQIDDTEVPYRSHSGFDFYNTLGEFNYIFKEIYKEQKYYPSTKTKGLSGIPAGYMSKNYETVIIDGYEVLIPQLEMLFLDKFLRRESNSREEGYDCELLAQRYNLDLNLIKQHLKDFYIKPMQIAKEERGEEYKQNFKAGIVKNIEMEYYLEDDNKEEYADKQFALEETIRAVNEKVKVATKMNIMCNGIRAKMFVPLTLEDVSMENNGEFLLSESYIKKSIKEISKVTEVEVNETGISTLQNLDGLFERINNQLGIDDYAGLAYDNNALDDQEEAKILLEGNINEEGGKA